MCGGVVFFFKSALLKAPVVCILTSMEFKLLPPKDLCFLALCCRHLRETATIIDHPKSQATYSSSLSFFHHPSSIDLLHVLSFQQVMENGLDVSPA